MPRFSPSSGPFAGAESDARRACRRYPHRSGTERRGRQSRALETRLDRTGVAGRRRASGARRGERPASPFAVGTISFLVAMLVMAAVLLATLSVTKTPRPRLAGLSSMPWWAWIGGLAGATYVTTMFTAIPVIGAAAAVSLTVAGQQVAGIFVDTFGWFRLPQRFVSGVRLTGVVLLLAGCIVIKAL
ncbi:DMT family transporter [Mesorhizobium sp. ArgA1]